MVENLNPDLMTSRSDGHALTTAMFVRMSPTQSGGQDSRPSPASETLADTLRGLPGSSSSDTPGLCVWGRTMKREMEHSAI